MPGYVDTVSDVTLGRIPRFRFKIGGIEEIFYTNDSTKSKTTHEYDAATMYNNLDTNFPGNVAFCKEVGVLTIKPEFCAENTRLNGALPNSLTEGNLFEENLNINLQNLMLKHSTPLVSLSSQYYTTYWDRSKTLRSIYVNQSGINIYQKDNTGDSISDYYENNTSGACRIKNDKVNTAETNKYVCLKLSSSGNLPYSANKGMYFEFNISNSIFNPENVSCTKLVKSDSGSNILTGQFVSLNEKHICIQLGCDTDYTKYLLLQENQAPVFVTEYTKTKIFNTTIGPGVVKFPISKTFNIKITPYINSLLVESDIFDTFNVQVDANPNSKEYFDCVGAGLKVSLIGFGEFSFAFGQIKYRERAAASDNLYNFVYCNRIISVQEFDTDKDFTKEAYVFRKNINVGYELVVNRTTTNNDGSPISASTTPKNVWVLYLLTDDPFLTPYAYKVIVGQNITQVSPAPSQSLALAWQELLVTDINISTTATGLTKLTKSGSITFSNKKTYIDGKTLHTPTIPQDVFAMDWTIINQRAIKIEFAYAYIGEDSEFIELTEADWEPLFTGFITDPNTKKDNFGNSTISFKLEDRWMQVSDCKVTWSRYYDGVKQIDTILDCLRESGIYAPKRYSEYAAAPDPTIYDVVISSDPMVTSFVLPLPPNALLHPAYKPKIKTSVQKFLDTICEISNVVTYFDASGKFNIKHLREITGSFATNNYTVFADYVMSPDDVPAIQPLMLTPPWNNIQSPVFNRDVKTGVYNTVFVFGPNEVPNTIAVDWDVANDLRSIHDTTATNYIGYKKILFKAMLAYGSKQIRQLMARRYLAEASYPQERYSWTSLGNTLPVFTYVNFRENHIKTGVNESTVYFLIKNDFSYSSKDFKCISTMEAKRLKGLFQLYGIVE